MLKNKGCPSMTWHVNANVSFKTLPRFHGLIRTCSGIIANNYELDVINGPVGGPTIIPEQLGMAM
jgi:hypothetical protein